MTLNFVIDISLKQTGGMSGPRCLTERRVRWRGAAAATRGAGAAAAAKFVAAAALLRDTGGCTWDLGAATGGGATATASADCAGVGCATARKRE